MSVFELVRLATGTLTANKLRAVLTMIGISIGVGAVIALLSIGAGVQQFITDQFSSAGTNLIAVVPGRIQRGPGGGAFGQQAPLTMSDYRVVAANTPYLADVSVDFSRPGVFSYADKTSEVNVSGAAFRRMSRATSRWSARTS